MQYRLREVDELKPSGVEWLGDIYKNWNNGKLKYFIKLVSGVLTQKTDNGKYFLYGANGIIGVTDYFNIKEKSIIIGRVGSSGYINIAKKESWISDNALIVKIKKENLFQYIYYVLKFIDLNRFASFNAQPLISATTINNLNIYIPNLEIQQKIANFLDEKSKIFDDALSKKEQLIKKLEDAKQSLISEVVSGKLKVVEKDEKSENWKRKKLGYIFKFKNGVNSDASNYGKGLKFINVKETIYTNHILEKDIKDSVSVSKNQIKENLVKKGDVLFNRTSEILEELALSTVYYDNKDVLFGGFVIRGRQITNDLDLDFKRYCFQSEDVRNQIISFGSGSIRKNIAQTNLKDVYISFPNIDIQKKISKYLDAKTELFDKTIEKTKQSILKLKQAKESLISQAVTGKIEIL